MDVVFAVLPFADLSAPAIGVSTLKAELDRRGFRSRIRYFAFDLAEAIGPELYALLVSPNNQERVTRTPPTDSLIGEWFFARAAHRDAAPDDDGYVSEFLEPNPFVRPLLSRLLDARDRLDEIVEAWAQDLFEAEAPIVGFTTVFHQTNASLAVARRLKDREDGPLVVFGGANCAGPMGVQMIRSFPWIDYVCIGEGDEVFPEFVARVRSGDASEIPGMVGRQGAGGERRAPMVKNMDALPIPDYTDFFARQRRSPLAEGADTRILIETSRGCWWGQKHHCTFCGLNAETMTFRAKSADRVIEELETLTSTYRHSKLDCVDNIMHMQYLRTLFPRLARSGKQLDLFYEVKANLRYDQLQVLRDAGITRIQAGIESFSDDVLKRMDKGCTGLQNIQLLRWSGELGLDVIWNIIYGFPGESPEDYDHMARLVPLLTHLRTPSFMTRFRMDRFSPNFMRAAEAGLTDVAPSPAYASVFPVGPEALTELAYFFTCGYADGRDPDTYTRGLARAIDSWEDAWSKPLDERPRLDLIDAGEVALVEDTRAVAREPLHVLRGLERKVYLACDVARTVTSIAEVTGVDPTDIRGCLAALVEDHLMVEERGRYLSLAVFRTRFAADREVPQEAATATSPPRPRSSATSAELPASTS